MNRLVIILATTLSILFGTGSLNVLCKCGSCQEDADRTTAAPHCDDAPANDGCSSCCCGKPKEPPTPAEKPAPGKKAPGRCGCLFWTEVPLSTPITLPGLALVRQALELSPVLHLDEGSAPPRLLAVAFIRDGPPRPHHDDRRRPQAWHCVWTI